MTQSMQLRLVQSNEISNLLSLLEIRRSYQDDLDEGRLRSRFLRELGEVDNRLFYFGFLQSGEPAAYVQLLLKNADNDPELADGKLIAHVHDLRVRMELQGQKIGQSMMKHLEAEVRARGINTLTLGVDNWNERAIRFYLNLGYSKFKQVSGRTDDEVCFLMRKDIR